MLSLALSATVLTAENWPMWRGPRMDGTSREKSVPIGWSGESNLVWKVPVPGVGHASPIVWENRIFTVTCLTQSQERALLCFDAKDGKVLWQTLVLASPLERRHKLNSHASSTPATDGELVFSAFLDGKEMVVSAHDFSGKPRWRVRPGPFSSMHGFCSSPIIYQDKVIVNGDHDGDGFLVALDRKTGRELWRIDRPNKTRSYCAPAIFEVGGRTQMVMSGSKCVTSYEPATGKLHWIIDGPTDQFVASLVYSPKADLFFITGGFPDHHILAIDPHGEGNVTKTHIRWRTTKGVAYVPSPIIEGDYFLIVSDRRAIHCFEARTGQQLWQEEVEEHHASLVSVEGLVYFVSDDGIMRVVKPSKQYKQLTRSELGERCYASPAISGGRLYLRGFQHLFCIGK